MKPLSKPTEQIRISGKNLGQLALDGFCPRCFWIKLKCKLPYQIFPGIFSSIDAYSKRVTGSFFDRHGRAPDWFGEFGELKELVHVPHHSKFQFLNSKTGVLVTGAPDELVRREDGSLLILDYKTSNTETQDVLLPMYRVQLNTYGYIAEQIGLGKVSGLALLYYEPVTALTVTDVDSVVRADGFAMRFNAKVLPIPLEPRKIPGLLWKVRAIFDLPDPPAGRVGCKDCMLLDGLVGSSQQIWRRRAE